MERQFLGLVLLAVVAIAVAGTQCNHEHALNITNNCAHTVWPAISTGASSALPPDTTGFELAPGESRGVSVPCGWSGRVWGRTLCSTASGTGKFTCVTGDCGSGVQECAGGNAEPPVTAAKFTVNESGGMDLYDVSLVDGYNLPMLVVLQNSAAAGLNCLPAGCVVDLSCACPAELRVPGVAACKSTCLAFGSPRYCYTSEYGNPDTCKASPYSEFFKKACPRAYSYAHDGATSTSTCAASDSNVYVVTFCPSTSRGKSKLALTPNSQPTGTVSLQPHTDGTTPYAGGSQVGGAMAPWRIALLMVVLSAVTAALGVLAAFWGLFKHCCNQGAAGVGVANVP